MAAIAPEVAAIMYDLDILAKDIQTIKDNATRFLIISKNVADALNQSDRNKASLRFCADHKRESLATVLNVMSDCNLNLTKIQSLPVIETPWYAFFVDVSFEEYAFFEKAKALLDIMVEDFKVLGEYKNARKG